MTLVSESTGFKVKALRIHACVPPSNESAGTAPSSNAPFCIADTSATADQCPHIASIHRLVPKRKSAFACLALQRQDPLRPRDTISQTRERSPPLLHMGAIPATQAPSTRDPQIRSLGRTCKEGRPRCLLKAEYGRWTGTGSWTCETKCGIARRKLEVDVSMR